ncbi:coiled-coil domain-containing protein [Flavobacterium faecale]|uniref:coiled-coil domain-containing protein n=1 Tax=Flavobacterium faecale TaxID=1355330 RepID=UPI003AAC2140
MEHTNNKSEQAVETANDNLQTQMDNLSNQKVERVRSFREYAFEKAGLNRGDHLYLKANLQWIKDGHLVDETYNEKEEHLLKQQVQNKIIAKDEEKEKMEGDKRTAIEVSKPSIEKKIKDLNDEIQQTKIDLAENKVETGYQPEKHFMYAGLTVLLSFYLMFFYASAIYASFFRNAGTLLRTAGDDITLYMDSIFDVNGIFTASSSLIIVYLGAFLFFAIGLIPHSIEGKHKKLNIVLVVIAAFITDCFMAYKIDLGIHDLKVMAGIADEDWNFYSSINFYMVLLFGFCAYLVWGYMFEMMLKEKNKKTGDAKAAIIIKGLKEEIKSLKNELQILETKIIELETQIKSILSQLEQLKKDLEGRMLNPDVLSQNLTSFYMGWRQYLNGTDLNLEKVKCEETFNDFIKSQFNQAPNLN